MAEALKKQAQYLKDNGFTEQQANALVYFQKDFIEDHLATKLDIEMVRKDIEAVRSELKKDIEMVRKDIEAVRSELKKDIEMVRKEIEMAKKDLTIRLGGIMVGGLVALSIIIQLLNQ